ncbi:interferon-induced, double-stranded RNA-activated protein kinase-like isoform X2 [Pempheris klunzingeri]|uniref:interferon-induced, double-stranded RNA-activated protein kinase-like isoform X2 n=1 Tax=Pempheris klunzingeri TaxID=3127111 RepID=UPI0039800868
MASHYVVRLNEFAQRTRSELSYEDVGSAGPDHIKIFTQRAVLNGKAYPAGVGKNKKEAKQNAAKNALRGLSEEPVDATENAAEASPAPVHRTSVDNINYICWLNEYGQKNKVNIKAVLSTKPGPNSVAQCCRFVVGEKEYPAATGKTKREAKEEAARLIYHQLCGSEATEAGDEKHVSSSGPEEELSRSTSDICDGSVRTKGERSFTETNFMENINRHCQKTTSYHDYILEERCGPAHDPQFFYKLVIDKKEYPVAKGKTVKEAKQNAAQVAWSALQESDRKMSSCSAVSDDDALSPPSGTLESCDTKSKSVVTTSSDSVVFTNSSAPPKDQIQSPDAKPKIRIAANFSNLHKNKEDMMANLNEKNTGKSHSEKTTTKSAISRFTSEFDSIVCLGSGAFGQVFKAKHKLLKKDYAIKVVRCREKALREATALSDLHHCNIVRYYTCWLEDSGYQWDATTDSYSTSQSTNSSSIKYLYIQMELCDTKTLRVWIDEKNTQNVKKSLRDSKRREESRTIIQQVVGGVEYIHSKMLIHRDLKPANIMFGQDGKVKIGDFGLVTTENSDDAENLLERTVYKGTPSYMAPEQRSRSTYDRKVDIFALGLIYFELLWNISTSHERKAIWEDVRNQKPPQGFLHNFHLENQTIKSMLCVKPEDRPEASKLKTDLEEYARTLALKNTHHVSKSY